MYLPKITGKLFITIDHLFILFFMEPRYNLVRIVIMNNSSGLGENMPKSIILKNCWVIMKCERHAGGQKVHEFGECLASAEGMGHTCWAIDGTLCGNKIQGTANEKLQSCTMCEIYRKYNRINGTKANIVKYFFPQEEQKYQQLLENRIENYLYTNGINKPLARNL